MSARDRRSKRKQQVMGNHQRCWLWGRHLVLETLKAQRWPILELVLSDELDSVDLQRMTEFAEELTVSITVEHHERLTQLSGARDHQGMLARMPPYPFCSLDDIQNPPSGALALMVLDRIQDPHNFGAMIRAAEVMGLHGMVVGEKHQSDVTAAVARSSAGAVNHLPICRVANLNASVERLKENGVTVIATAMRNGVSLSEWDFTQPTAIILGNENTGVSQELLDDCEASVHIPQAGHVESLNAAVAAGIVCYELRRQRQASPPTT